MPTTERKPTSKPIEVQISATVRRPKNGRRIPDKVIREAILYKARTGEDVPGIDLSIVRWRHGASAVWTEATDSADEWFRFARFLPAASFIVIARPALRSR